MRRVGDLTKKMKLSVAAFKGKSPGKDWFDGFMKRHQDLSIRKPEKLTTTRARMLNPVVVTNYLNDLRFRGFPFNNELRWHGSTSSIYTGHYCDITTAR
jgi:hypothetical protein